MRCTSLEESEQMEGRGGEPSAPFSLLMGTPILAAEFQPHYLSHHVQFYSSPSPEPFKRFKKQGED